MDSMNKALPAVLLMALAIVPLSPVSAGSTASAPAATQTAPPQIYHIITRPLCAELHKHIAPAVGMMLQNDQQIAKSPHLFKQYNQASLSKPDNDPVNNSLGQNTGVTMTGDAANGTMTPAQNMALLGMENLVSPIANNIIAIKKVLDSPALTQGTGMADDDKRLAQIRDKLLRALATQSAALDIINGFVDTQQLADIQHSGQEYISAMNQSDIIGKAAGQGLSTPMPGTYDPNQAGLPADPYTINLANVPGLTLGYNPVTRLIDALHWTIAQTQSHENEAAKAVLASAALCANGTPSAPNH